MTARPDLRTPDDPEARLLIHCARASVEPERAERIRALAAGEPDWHRLLAVAERNGLSPLLFWHLSRTCPGSVPADAFELLRDYFQKNSAFSLLLTGELLRLLAVLNSHGIEAVPYKGPALAVRLYGHVALRHFGDLDIMVRARDVWRAGRLIEAQGFEPQFRVPEERRRAFVRDGYVRAFYRDERRTLVELHWGVASRSFALRFDTETVWPRLQPMVLQGQTVLMPPTEDLILMLSIHGSKHGWDKLEGLCGLAELMRSKDAIDWTYVWRRAREMHCRRMLAFGVRLAHDLFDVPLPPGPAALVQSRTFETMTGSVVRDFSLDVVPPRTRARRAALDLRLKDTFADCARYCAGLVFTVRPGDWSAVRLRGPLAAGYPLVHFVRAARKHALSRLRESRRCP